MEYGMVRCVWYDMTLTAELVQFHFSDSVPARDVLL